MIDLRTDNPDSVAWQSARTADTLTRLHAVDGYADFGAAVLRYSDAARRWPPVRAGRRWFQPVHPDGAELPSITVRDSRDEAPRVLVDFNDHANSDGAPIASSWMQPSPDGNVLAYAVTAQGTEINEVFLVDATTGRRLPDQVPWNVHGAPSWLPDSSGFWCATRDIDEQGVRVSVRRFLIGEPASDWVAPLPEDLQFPAPTVSDDGRRVAISSGNAEFRVDYLIDEDLQVSRLLEGVPGSFRGTIADDTLLALTDNGAPLGRVVSIPLATSTDLDTWTELVPESSDYITDFERFGDIAVVTSLRRCTAAMDVLDLRTGERTPVELPGRGGIGAIVERAAYPLLPAFVRGDGEISFIYSDLATSPAIYRFVVGEHRLECLEPPATTLEGVTVTSITAVSADGTEIPAHVIHRADLDLSRPHPTLLTGYGGFRVAELPAYVNGHAAWIEAGGIHVLAHLRGGSEFGAQWWRNGRRDKKQNTFDDFYAVAEKLFALGWTDRHHLAIYGASNGGLLTAAAVTQRPELWAAVVSDVPATDLLHLDSAPLLYAIGRDEYGDPKIPAERRWLAAIDPLTNARPADYPATLVVAGANDPRCPAGQARLLVDAVDKVQTGTEPILLRVHPDQGHGAFGAAESARRLTEILVFCAAHTGLSCATGEDHLSLAK